MGVFALQRFARKIAAQSTTKKVPPAVQAERRRLTRARTMQARRAARTRAKGEGDDGGDGDGVGDGGGADGTDDPFAAKEQELSIALSAAACGRPLEDVEPMSPITSQKIARAEEAMYGKRVTAAPGTTPVLGFRWRVAAPVASKMKLQARRARLRLAQRLASTGTSSFSGTAALHSLVTES